MKIDINGWTGFTAADFSNFDIRHRKGETGEPLEVCGEPELREYLNEILAEKLGQAEVVSKSWKHEAWFEEEADAKFDTHTARLVCIEELEQPNRLIP